MGNWIKGTVTIIPRCEDITTASQCFEMLKPHMSIIDYLEDEEGEYAIECEFKDCPQTRLEDAGAQELADKFRCGIYVTTEEFLLDGGDCETHFTFEPNVICNPKPKVWTGYNYNNTLRNHLTDWYTISPTNRYTHLLSLSVSYIASLRSISGALEDLHYICLRSKAEHQDVRFFNLLAYEIDKLAAFLPSLTIETVKAQFTSCQTALDEYKLFLYRNKLNSNAMSIKAFVIEVTVEVIDDFIISEMEELEIERDLVTPVMTCEGVDTNISADRFINEKYDSARNLTINILGLQERESILEEYAAGVKSEVIL